MSAPDTNIETQTRRHKGPLAGMPLAIALAVVAFLAYLLWSWFGTFDASGPQAGTMPEVPATARDGGQVGR